MATFTVLDASKAPKAPAKRSPLAARARAHRPGSRGAGASCAGQRGGKVKPPGGGEPDGRVSARSDSGASGNSEPPPEVALMYH